MDRSREREGTRLSMWVGIGKGKYKVVNVGRSRER